MRITCEPPNHADEVFKLPPLPLQAMTLRAVSVTPSVLVTMLRAVLPQNPSWDFRPDPNRFTLREILAHLADMERVYQQRIQRTCVEEEPFLPDVDPDALAAENDYGRRDPHRSLMEFEAARLETIHILEGLQNTDWKRQAMREHVGVLTVQEQVMFMLTHDCYHTGQVACYVSGDKVRWEVKARE